MPGNDELRVKPLEALHGLLRDLRGAAEEEGAVTLFRRSFDKPWDEIGARDAFWKRIAKKPGSPNEGSSVAEREVRFDKDSAQFDIFESLDAEVYVSGNNIVRVAAGHHVIDSVEGSGNGQIVKGNAQQCGGQVWRRDALLDRRYRRGS